LFWILLKILVVFCSAGPSSIRVSGLKEVWKTVKRASKPRNRFAPKRGAQCVESSNIKGVTQFKNLKTLYSHNLKRINLTDILHRCPYMWNCSIDRDSIFGCNFFLSFDTHCVCVCGRGESTLPSVKAYRGLCALC